MQQKKHKNQYSVLVGIDSLAPPPCFVEIQWLHVDMGVKSADTDMDMNLKCDIHLKRGAVLCADIPFDRNVDYYYGSPYIEIKYTVHLQRRPLYYVIYMILPTTVISFMSLLAFLLPADCGEKIGLGLLYHCLFVSHSLIHSSTVGPARGVYIIIIIIISLKISIIS